MLEICQNAAGSTYLATDRHSHNGPSWTPSSHTYEISFDSLLHYPRRQVWRTVIGKIVRRWPSFQNTSTLGIWVLGLLLWTSWRTCRKNRHRHDGPSKALLPHTWSDFPIFFQQLHYAATYRPSQARRTVICSVGGLFCISSLKISAFNFGLISCKTKRNLY